MFCVGHMRTKGDQLGRGLPWSSSTDDGLDDNGPWGDGEKSLE